MTSIQKQFFITEQYANQRLDQALAGIMPEYSRSRIKAWIETGELLVNGKTWRPRDKVKGGETVTLSVQLEDETDWKAQDIPLNIVYEDDDLIVINKPVDMVVHPGAGNPDGTLVNALLHYCPALNELPRAGIVHRLDKDTTGLLVVAKTVAAHTSLVKQLQARTVHREYEAIVQGLLTTGFTVDQPIGRHPHQRTKMAVVAEGLGKPAVSHVRVIERYREHTRVRVQLETGRTHQIRVHLTYRHYPIVGDSVYGARLIIPAQATELLVQALRNFKRQALHAYQLSLSHPSTHKLMSWTAKLPQDMQNLIHLLHDDAITHQDMDY